ncbi:MAG: hypothetical protein KBD06_01455 [Candidatus Pacebacteria bacterium]|nr:hypothetical protein [Candidatus Paceibacterota bacterium]
MPQDQTPVAELKLDPQIIEVLQAHGIHHYGSLCCVTLGELKQWGLEQAAINQVVSTARR